MHDTLFYVIFLVAVKFLRNLTGGSYIYRTKCMDTASPWVKVGVIKNIQSITTVILYLHECKQFSRTLMHTDHILCLSGLGLNTVASCQRLCDQILLAEAKLLSRPIVQ